MIKIKIFTLIVTISFTLLSCTDRSSPINTDEFFDIVFFQMDNTNTDAFLYSTCSTYMTKNLPNVISKGQRSFFYDSTGHSIFASSVGLNGFNISQRSDTLDIPFNGSFHYWNIIGNNTVPTYNDTIQSINSFVINSPLPWDTIYKNSGFTIYWSNIANLDSVAIFAEMNKDLTEFILQDSNYCDNVSYIRNFKRVANIGSAYLPTSFFNGFANNNYVTLKVIGYRYKRKSIGDKNAQTTCIVDCETNYLLK